MNFGNLAAAAANLMAVASFLAFLIRPIRERLLGMEAIREGDRCLLRAEIVRIYYRHLEGQCLREYEYRLLVSCYEAYKALGGNSFVDRIYGEMVGWKIVE